MKIVVKKQNHFKDKVNQINKISYKKNSSHIYHNLPAVPHYWLNGKIVIFDNYPIYNSTIDEFLDKRWISKHEIPPKIKIVNAPQSLIGILSTQKFHEKSKKIVSYDENMLRFLHEKGHIDRNYIFNTLFEKNEIDLTKEILDKVVINGYVVKYIENEEEYNEYNKNLSLINRFVGIFYDCNELTEKEKIIQAIYSQEKFEKWNRYSYSKSKYLQCFITELDLMRSKGLVEFKENNFKKGYVDIEKLQERFDVNLYLDTLYEMKSYGRGQFRKFLLFLRHNEFYFRNIYKVKFMTSLILSRLSIFLNSEEFNKTFDCELDFYISNAILSMHLWLICQRLNDFKRSKIASDILTEILKIQKSDANKAFQQVDTLRKISKFRNIQEIYEDQKISLHWHFKVYNSTVENPFYKIDSLVWSQIFREKISRYDDRVYKMSHYLIHHFNKLKTLTFEYFENFELKFDLSCIPLNYKDKILRYNPKLDDDTLLKEKFSNFQYKKYYYDYKSPEERNQKELMKTFIRQTYYNSFDKKNYSLRSRRKEDCLYDELEDEERNNFLSQRFTEDLPKIEQPRTPVNIMFNLWYNKHYSRIMDICEEEDKLREKGEYNSNFIKTMGKENKIRFSENLPKAERERLYEYRFQIETNPKAEKDEFRNAETKIFYPDANVINQRRRRKPLVDKIFYLN